MFKIIKTMVLLCLITNASGMKRELVTSEEKTKKKRKIETAIECIQSRNLFKLLLSFWGDEDFDLNQIKKGIPLICFILQSDISQLEKDDWINFYIRWNTIMPFSKEIMPTISFEDNNKSLYELAKEKNYFSLWVKIQKEEGLNDFDGEGFPFIWNFLTTIKMGKDLKFKWLDLMIQKGLTVDLQTPSGLTILHAKIECGSIKWVEKLLKLGADPHIKDNRGWSALHWAADAAAHDYRKNKEVHLAILKKIAQYTSNLNIQSKHGKTALHYAAYCKRSSSMLVTLGADFEIKDDKQKTPYEYAYNKYLKRNDDIKSREMVKEAIIFPQILPQTGNLVSFVQKRELTGGYNASLVSRKLQQ